jgi:hypothetical protein
VQNVDNTMTCTLDGGWPNSTAYVISGNLWQYSAPETSYDLVKHLFWTGMPINAIRRAGITFPTDASGNGSFTFSNPPSAQGLFVIQALVTDPVGVYRGSSTARSTDLRSAGLTTRSALHSRRALLTFGGHGICPWAIGSRAAAGRVVRRTRTETRLISARRATRNERRTYEEEA